MLSPQHADGAVGAGVWWIFDSQFSIILVVAEAPRPDHREHQLLGDVTWARICVIFANIWRGVPFVAITLLAGLQTVQPSLYEAATLDGASKWRCSASSPIRC